MSISPKNVFPRRSWSPSPSSAKCYDIKRLHAPDIFRSRSSLPLPNLSRSPVRTFRKCGRDLRKKKEDSDIQSTPIMASPETRNESLVSLRVKKHIQEFLEKNKFLGFSPAKTKGTQMLSKSAQGWFKGGHHEGEGRLSKLKLWLEPQENVGPRFRPLYGETVIERGPVRKRPPMKPALDTGVICREPSRCKNKSPKRSIRSRVVENPPEEEADPSLKLEYTHIPSFTAFGVEPVFFRAGEDGSHDVYVGGELVKAPDPDPLGAA